MSSKESPRPDEMFALLLEMHDEMPVNSTDPTVVQLQAAMEGHAERIVTAAFKDNPNELKEMTFALERTHGFSPSPLDLTVAFINVHVTRPLIDITLQAYNPSNLNPFLYLAGVTEGSNVIVDAISRASAANRGELPPTMTSERVQQITGFSEEEIRRLHQPDDPLVALVLEELQTDHTGSSTVEKLTEATEIRSQTPEKPYKTFHPEGLRLAAKVYGLVYPKAEAIAQAGYN